MKLSRRNAILGIGVAALGGGAVLGSGAFTQTQATRDSILTISDDAEALLAIESLDSGLAQTVEGAGRGNNQIIELNFDRDGSGINVDGVTRFDGVIEVTNNSDNTTVDLVIAGPEGNNDRRARSRVLANGQDITKESGFYDGLNTGNFRFIDGVPDDGAFELQGSVTLDFEFETRRATRTGVFSAENRFKAFDDIGADNSSKDVRVDGDLEETFSDN